MYYDESRKFRCSKTVFKSFEEGFGYIEESFLNSDLTNSDVVLGDIFAAFVSMNQTNVSLEGIFQDDKDVLKQVSGFYKVVDEIEKLEAVFNNEEEKQFVLKEKVIPAFREWKIDFQHAVMPYVSH